MRRKGRRGIEAEQAAAVAVAVAGLCRCRTMFVQPLQSSSTLAAAPRSRNSFGNGGMCGGRLAAAGAVPRTSWTSTSAGVATASFAGVAIASAARRGRRVACPATAEPVAWRGGRPQASSLPYLPDGNVDYASIDRNPISQVLMGTVRSLLAKEAGHDSPTPGYAGVMELVREVNDSEGTADALQTRARKGVFEKILPSLFIGWVPPIWKDYIQPNVPSWLANFAFFVVFYVLFPWLMGPMEGDDFLEVEVPKQVRNILFFLPETFKVPQTVKAERCRFLEQSNCASVCVNTCKVPSQGWLTDDFGMELHIQPNYDDFSCRWKFGQKAPPLMEDEAIMVPCFTNCPSSFKGTKDALSMRQKIREEDDRRLAAAVAELTRDGSALSPASLEQRVGVVGKGGKCWSVDEKRSDLRNRTAAEMVAQEAQKLKPVDAA